MNYLKPIESYKGFKIYPYMTNKSFYFEDSHERVFGKDPSELKKEIETRIKDGFYLKTTSLDYGEVEQKIKEIKEEK